MRCLKERVYGGKDMNTMKMNFSKIDFEKIMITLGMGMMEVFGVITLFCGLFDVKLF